MSKKLFDDDDESTGINLENSYAKRYDQWREKEEYEKLKAKHGDKLIGSDSDGSSSSSDEDENAQEITPALERNFFGVLSRLKSNADELYRSDVEFFPSSAAVEPTDAGCTGKKRRAKPLHLRDYERAVLLGSSKISADHVTGASGDESGALSYAEEQRTIKAGFRAVLDQSDDEQDAADEPALAGMLTKRSKTSQELEKEEGDYREWLRGQKSPAADVEHLEALRSAWTDPKICKDEAFLRDYILNKRYLGEGDDSYIPSYEEVVHDSEADLSEDERTLQQQDTFENKFNFRFQEPDQEFIKKYPRTIKDSLRRKDERRKQERQQKKSRKQEEQLREEEEIKRLKALKKKQILEKLDKLRETVGNDQLPFTMDDLDTDFDPDTHERKMNAMFADDYDFEGDVDEEKPVFSDNDQDEIAYWENWQPDNAQSADEQDDVTLGEGAPACENPNFNMDCEFDAHRAALQRQMIEATDSRKNRRRRRGRERKRGDVSALCDGDWRKPLAEALARDKPSFCADTMQLGGYLDEFYKLDERLSRQPFKYRSVMANDYGLSTEEVLTADERELNRWMSLKKMCQYKRPDQEASEVRVYRVKAANTAYKHKILPSVYASTGEDVDGGADPGAADNVPAKKSKKKRKKKDRECTEQQSQQVSVEPTPDVQDVVRNEEDGMSKSGELEQQPQEPSVDVTKDERKKRKKSRRTGSMGRSDGDVDQQTTQVDVDDVEGKETRDVEAEAPINDAVEIVTNSSVSDTAKRGGGKKRRRDVDATANDDRLTASTQNDHTDGADDRKRSRNGGRVKKKKKAAGSESSGVLSMSNARLRAFGLNPKKFKNKIKYGKNAAS